MGGDRREGRRRAALSAVLAVLALAGCSGDIEVTEASAVATWPSVDLPSSDTQPDEARAAPPTATSIAEVQIGTYERPVIDPDNPAVVARPVPNSGAALTTLAPPPWQSATATRAGRVSIDVGCAESSVAIHLDNFFAEQVGPVLGWDYQHIYPLGGERWLWLFQDAFIDYSGAATSLGESQFVHNAALVQEGSCFTLLYSGSPKRPEPFEVGTGTSTLERWFWPMGGELMDSGELGVFWVEMVKDGTDPAPPDGLGWHPVSTYLARYDPATLERTSFEAAANSGVTPVYGYSVASDDSHTYLFANTFEQNLSREGGYWNGPHSAAKVWLARVPKGQLASTPEYRGVDGWVAEPSEAVPVSERYWAENPFQVRYLDGQWVATTAVDGYWGDHLAVDVAYDPWGPWLTTAYQPLAPRGDDPKMNTYHAHPLPWRGVDQRIQIAVSNNARDMVKDAWPNPQRYRPQLFSFPYTPTPTTVPAPAPGTLAPTTTINPPETLGPVSSVSSAPPKDGDAN